MDHFIREETARTYVSQGKFYEAAALLEELDEVEDEDIGMKIMKMDCYLHLGRENKAEAVISDINAAMLNSSIYNVHDIENLVNIFMENSCPVRALVLSRIAINMHKASMSAPKVKKEGYVRCLNIMDSVIQSMLKQKEPSQSKEQKIEFQEFQKLHELFVFSLSNVSNSKNTNKDLDRHRTIAIDFGIPYITEALNILVELEYEDSVEKVCQIGKFASRIGQKLVDMGFFRGANAIIEIGILAFSTQFRQNASKYDLYATLHTTTSMAFYGLHKYNEAVTAATRALEAKQRAEDISLNEKKDDVKKIKKKIEFFHSFLV